MNDTLTIRPLRLADADALLRFYRELPPWIVHWFEPFPEADRTTIGEHLAGAAAGDAISLGLIARDGTVCGHAFLLDLSAAHAVFGCGLREAIIHMGHGRRLMQAVMAEADKRRIPKVSLTVFKDNLRARRLYESFGFVDAGDVKCRKPGDSLLMERLCNGATGGDMRIALLQQLNGYRPDRAVWTADLSYWLNGRGQDGTADPAWQTEEGYLRFHRKLGVMPYYFYDKFWAGRPVYDSTVQESMHDEAGRTVRLLKTPLGSLREETVFLAESCCQGVARHMVETEDDLDVLLFILEHRRLEPDNLGDYGARRKLWAEYGGLPCLGLPRSPLPALAYEWAGLQNMVMLMLDCPGKVAQVLDLMEQQEEPVLDAVCRLAPPLVHFPDNLSSDSFTSYYDGHMRQRYRKRLDRLHAAGIRTAVHLDGVVRGLLPKLIAAGFDAVEALTPCPAGDVTVDEMVRIADGSRTLLWGGMPGTMFAPPYDWHDVEEHVAHVLQAWASRPFVLGVADQVPPDGDIEFCSRIAQMLNPGGY